jgi:hypothetical protein
MLESLLDFSRLSRDRSPGSMTKANVFFLTKTYCYSNCLVLFSEPSSSPY